MKKIKQSADQLLTVLFIAGFISISIGLWYGYSSYEAQSYNRNCNAQVTGFDAMFTNLVIDGKCQQRVQDTKHSLLP